MKNAKISDIVVLTLLTYMQWCHSQETQPKSIKCLLKNSTCLTSQAQNTLKELVESKTLNTLHLKTVQVHTSKFSYNWTNMEVDGIKNAVIDNVSIDMDLKVMRVSFATPIHMKFIYNADGILFSFLPVYGTGNGEITLNKMLMEIIFVFEITKDNNGKDVMDLKSYDYGFDFVDGAHYNFHEMYNGDKKKIEVLHKFINDSWRSVVAHFSQSVNRELTSEIFGFVKLYMGSRPLEELALY